MYFELHFVYFILLEPEEDDEDTDDIYGSIAVGVGAVGAPSAPSWTDLPPASLLGKDGETLTTSPRGSPRKTPVTSPAKSSGLSSPANSPSKVSQRTGDSLDGCGWLRLWVVVENHFICPRSVLE